MFTSHYLSSPKNQEVIRNAEKVTKRKEELAKAKSEASKKFYRQKKKRKNRWLERRRSQ